VLFENYGIRKVTVEEVCQEAGVSKMTFYRNFKNKNTLAEQVMIDTFKEWDELYEEIMKQPITFEDKFKQLMVLKYHKLNAFSEAFLKDVFQNEACGLKDCLMNHKKKRMERMMEHFKEAQDEGFIRKELKLPFVFFLMNDWQEKARDERIVAMYGSYTNLSVEMANFFLYGMINPNQTESK
jgi:AcrR family transcriptional regulator